MFRNDIRKKTYRLIRGLSKDTPYLESTNKTLFLTRKRRMRTPSITTYAPSDRHKEYDGGHRERNSRISGLMESMKESTDIELREELFDE